MSVSFDGRERREGRGEGATANPPEQKSNFGNAQQIHISSGKANAMLGPKHDANARRMA